MNTIDDPTAPMMPHQPAEMTIIPGPWDMTQKEFEANKTERLKALCSSLQAMSSQPKCFETFSSGGYGGPPFKVVLDELLRISGSEFYVRQGNL